MLQKWITVGLIGLGVVLHLAWCVPRSSEEQEEEERAPGFALEPDIEDFLNILPAKAISDLALESYRRDFDVRKAFDYVKSDEFQQLKNRTLQMEITKRTLQFFNEAGLDLLGLFKKLSESLGIPPRQTLDDSDEDESLSSEHRENVPISGRGLTSLFERILMQFPQDEIFSLFFEKLESSAEFANFVERIGSGEFERLCTAIQVRRRTQIVWIEREIIGGQMLMEKVTNLSPFFSNLGVARCETRVRDFGCTRHQFGEAHERG